MSTTSKTLLWLGFGTPTLFALGWVFYGLYIPSQIHEHLIALSQPQNHQEKQHSLSFLKAHKERTLSTLFPLLQHSKKWQERAAAAHAIGALKLHTDEALFALSNALRDPHTHVIQAALQSFHQLGQHSSPYTSELTTLLKHNEKKTSIAHIIIKVLAKHHSKQSLHALFEALLRHPPHTNLHPHLIKALTPFHRQLQPLLLQHLFDTSSHKKHAAFSLLYALGPSSTFLLPSLLKKLQSSSLTTRLHTLRIIQAIGPHADSILPQLLQQLHSASLVTQIALLHTIGALGPKAKPALPTLRRLLHSKGLQKTTIQTIGEIGPNAAPLTPSLRALFRAPLTPFEQKLMILHTIGKIGPGASSALPLLLQQLRHTNSAVQLLAIHVIGQMKQKAALALPALLPFLRSKNSRLLLATLNAIKEIKSPPAKVLPALLPLLSNSSPKIAEKTILTITQFRKDKHPIHIPLKQFLKTLPDTPQHKTLRRRLQRLIDK